mgnify:CR=1 FL=1
MDLDKVIQQFTGPNSEDLYERHLAAIERLCKNNVGFPIRDLPKVQQILEIALRLLLKGNAGFLQPAVDLIRCVCTCVCVCVRMHMSVPAAVQLHT